MHRLDHPLGLRNAVQAATGPLSCASKVSR